ncbi:uncharacterized protein LOC130178456 [Seriola aureovittata]|uniref:uncharacterized protein LOC130178456 n=1 Tax=Seriola aureovittata TaxID=2871759 RepID=UPI0024BD9D91|nr:uncharacterized protein LOC130178456 [Seriola aureovittata]
MFWKIGIVYFAEVISKRAVHSTEPEHRQCSNSRTTSSYDTFRRMALVLLFSVFLLYSFHTQGSSAVSPVFVQKGKDLLLEVMEDVPEDFFIFQWKVNGSNTLVSFPPGREPIVSDVYTGRVEASVKNFSVKLKNLQEADSGVYTARVTGTQGDKTPAGYSVTVQDPVSPVAMTVDSVSNSSDSCSLTVTCSTQDSHHINSTFTCDNQTCSQEGGERSKVTTLGASLHVHLLKDSIICNHSNQVSWKKNMTNIRNICPLKTGVSNAARSILIGTTAGIVVVILCSVLYITCRRKNRQNTVYEVPQSISPAQTQSQSPTEDAPGCSPTSTYALVKFHSTPVESTKTKTTNLPETVYAEVNRANKSNPRPPPKKTTPRADETMI